MSAHENQRQAAGTVSLADEEAVRQILVSSVFGLWDIVNNLTRLRPSRRERYRVSIFGSARAQPGTYVYDEVKRRPHYIVAERISQTDDASSTVPMDPE